MLILYCTVQECTAHSCVGYSGSYFRIPNQNARMQSSSEREVRQGRHILVKRGSHKALEESGSKTDKSAISGKAVKYITKVIAHIKELAWPLDRAVSHG